jgi:Tfp pilus assembly protein PilX
MTGAKRPNTRRGGYVLILSIIALAVLAAGAMTLLGLAPEEDLRTDNQVAVESARMAAESGLEFYLEHLAATQLSPHTTAETLMTNLVGKLNDRLGGSTTFGGDSAVLEGDVITTPVVELSASKQFSATFTGQPRPDGDKDVVMTVTGSYEGIRRKTSMLLKMVHKRSPVFDYGIASKGKVYVNGNAYIDGSNMPSDADVLSTREMAVAIEAGGSAWIDGDLFVTGDSFDFVEVTGSAIIGGTSDPEAMKEHVHIGVEEPEFPAIDHQQFSSLATNVIDDSKDFKNANEFTNVRIKSGTNPKFTNDTVINGILYIEKGNTISFSSKVTLNCIVVCEDASDMPIKDNQLKFSGQVDAPGVRALANDPAFDHLQQYADTSILAPGFGLTFRGGSNVLNGLIAADQLDFAGTSGLEGEINGMVMGLTDRQMSLVGTTTLRVGGVHEGANLAGFIQPVSLIPLPGSYGEPQ